MKRLLVAAGVFGLILAPLSAFANIEAPPDPPPSGPVPFKITADRSTKENRLVIPRKFLDGAKTVSAKGAGIGPDLRTVIAGLAISVSLVSLAFLLIRKKSRAAQAIALFVALGGTGVLWINRATADIPPPISEIPDAWRRVGDGQKKLTIEITDKGDSVELILGTYYRSPSLDIERGQPRPEPPASPKSEPKPK